MEDGQHPAQHDPAQIELSGTGWTSPTGDMNTFDPAPRPSTETEWNDAGGSLDLLWLAIAFEGVLAAAAFACGWWTGVSPLSRFAWTVPGLLAGAGCALPMYVLFLASYSASPAPLRRIRRFLRVSLGRNLADAPWPVPAGIALLAGVGEELLFRGALEPLVGPWWSNVLFGLAHAVTPLYAVLAGAMGLLFSMELQATGNLLAPILTHALYDWLAFRALIADVRRFPVTDDELRLDPSSDGPSLNDSSTNKGQDHAPAS